MRKPLLLLSILIMIFAGFVPMGFSRLQRAEWVTEAETGLRFSGKALVYTDRFIRSSGDADGLTISLLLSPVFQDEPAFGPILSLYDKEDNTQITVGQWNRSLMVLAGNDFSNSRQEPKMYISIPSEEKIQIFVTSNRQGTAVYIDNIQVGFNPNLILPLPANPDDSYMTVGSSIFAWEPWVGTIHSLEIYDEVVFPESEDSGTQPLVSYRFDEQDGNFVKDDSGNGLDLYIAEKWIRLDRRFLRVPDLESLYQEEMQWDVVINFFGFMPFGFLLFLVCRRRFKIKRLLGVLFVLAWSFIFSLSIESIQILLPARDSSLLDLILNSLGGMSGGIAASIFYVEKTSENSSAQETPTLPTA